MVLKITFLPLWPPNDLWPNDYYVRYAGLDWWLLWQDSVEFGQSTTELHYQNKMGINTTTGTTRCSVNFLLSTTW